MKETSFMDSLVREPSAGPPVSNVLRITLVCFAVSMIDGFDTLMLSFVAPLLARSLQIDHATLGRIFGAGFIGTVLGSLIVGPLADRFGRRPMLLLALGVTGVFTLGCAFATSATMLATLRFIGGLGMGGAIPPVAAITAESSSPQRRSTLVILMFIGFPLGAVVGGAITAALMVRFGWSFVFLMGGAFALIVLIPVLLVIPAQPLSRVERAVARQQASARGLRVVGNVFADGRLAATLALWFGVLSSMILSGGSCGARLGPAESRRNRRRAGALGHRRQTRAVRARGAVVSWRCGDDGRPWTHHRRGESRAGNAVCGRRVSGRRAADVSGDRQPSLSR
jgi:AAHS family 4-hydroxybenzoate transporter-like MFS transporter